MAVSTLSLAGSRRLRRPFGTIMVVVAALAVSLVLVFAGAGHRRPAQRQFGHGQLRTRQPPNQSAYQSSGGYAPDPGSRHAAPTPENPNPPSDSAVGKPN